MRARLPQHASELDADWLGDVLQNAGVLGDARIVGLAIEPVFADRGFASSLSRVSPRYEPVRGSAPESVIVKLPPVEGFVRELVLGFGFFAREVAVFRELAPRLPLRLPRCFGAFSDDDGGALLVLEDVATDAGTSRESDAERARIAVDLLARLHARCWDDAALAATPWLTGDLEQRYRGAALLFESRIDGFRELCPDLPRAFAERLSDIARFIPSLAARAREPHCTLLHGDYRMDNLLFTGFGREPVVIDWQLTSWGAGAYDLAYFIGQSLPPEQRQSEQDELLTRYLEALRAGGVAGYSVQALCADYRRSLLASVMIAVNLSGTLLELERRAESGDSTLAEAASGMLPGMTELFDTISTRAIAAVLDNEALREL